MRVIPWLIVAVVVALLAWSASRFDRNRTTTNEPQYATRAMVPALIPERLARTDFAATLTQANEIIEKKRLKVRTDPREWINYEALAASLLPRARLTGSFDDYAEARSVVDKGLALSPKGTGPHLVSAAIAMATHRVKDARADLHIISRYVIPDMQTTAEATAMRGDLALYSGQYKDAARLYAKASEGGPWTGLTYRRAILASQTGQMDRARALYTEADTQTLLPTPAFRADILTRQGELSLSQGDWPEARKLFAEANLIYPGNWRIELRVAQMMALEGKMGVAIQQFERIATIANSPEAMDVAAGLYRAQGDGRRSRQWADRAGAIWELRLSQVPEAAWGHALEHELAFGSPQRALALAGRDVKDRPFGQAMIGVAKAWIANRRPDYAAALLEKVNASGWQSVEQHLILADAYALMGRGKDAEAEQQAAVALNPHALSRNPAFVWLDH